MSETGTRDYVTIGSRRVGYVVERDDIADFPWCAYYDLGLADRVTFHPTEAAARAWLDEQHEADRARPSRPVHVPDEDTRADLW